MKAPTSREPHGPGKEACRPPEEVLVERVLTDLDRSRPPDPKRGEGARAWGWEVEKGDGGLQVTLVAPARPVGMVMVAVRRLQAALEGIPEVRRLCITWIPEPGRTNR